METKLKTRDYWATLIQDSYSPSRDKTEHAQISDLIGRIQANAMRWTVSECRQKMDAPYPHCFYYIDQVADLFDPKGQT